MKGEKDEGKRIVPLFPPGLRRDEINLFGDKIVSAECSRPRAMVPIVVGGSTFASQASSSNNVSGEKRKQRPTLDFSAPSLLQSGKALSSEENSKLSLSHYSGKWSDDHDYVASEVKKEEISDNCIEDSVPGLNLANDEVVRVIGQSLFLKARKIMVHQQKVFSLQMFELHRLIAVQRFMARSPDILHDNTFHPNKPSIKFPPMNKLLYVSPLDTSSPSIAKPKADAPTSVAIADCGAEAVHGLPPLPKTSIEKGLSTPKTLGPLGPLTNPSPIPTDPKVAPWYLPPVPPACNQWLIPVRSPSEGLVYKPYPGPCFPTVGFMGPVYRPGPTYDVPAPNDHGGGGLYGPELTQTYIQPYTIPVTSSNPDSKPMISVQDDEPSSSERREKGALALFPTTPSLLKDQKGKQKVEEIKVVPHHRNSAPGQRDKQKVEVIKVVPHHRNSVLASAKRILRSIQEERRKHE